ncbi:hypothetical protein K469DRAFT_457304, partial [Zopfia rhizophila CBS 207.26]
MSYFSAKNGSRHPMFLAVTGTLLLLSVSVVSIRTYCRLVYVRFIGIDDYLMILALVFLIAMAVINVVHIGWGTGVIFVFAFECPKNPSDAWSPTFPKGCNSIPASYFSIASINIVTDIVILFLPIPGFMKLKLGRRKRWALIGIFMVGSIAVIASIVRLYALYIYTVTKDVAYDAIMILLWSQIEANIAIISASVPAIRPLFCKTFANS